MYLNGSVEKELDPLRHLSNRKDQVVIVLEGVHHRENQVVLVQMGLHPIENQNENHINVERVER